MHVPLTATEQKLSDLLQASATEVETHPIFSKIQTMQDLRVFMEHHVFAVWDFMSLLKYLQGVLAPSTWPWIPRPHGNLVRLVNEIVLGEECDRLPGSDEGPFSYVSHFDLYLLAMKEIGADTRPVLGFVEHVKTGGLNPAFETSQIPAASRCFMKDTFELIEGQVTHQIAAAFAFGRENVIPGMFQSLLGELGVGSNQAPVFYYYLQRHAELDGDEHGPAALRLVATLCDNDPMKVDEAVISAKRALHSRKTLWDNVLKVLQ